MMPKKKLSFLNYSDIGNIYKNLIAKCVMILCDLNIGDKKTVLK